MSQKLRENKDQILEIEANMNDAKNRLEEVRNLRNREKEVLDFFSCNKKQLKQLRKDVAHISLEDRKILVEGMLQDNIVVVNYQEDSEEDGPGGASADYRLKFNTEILHRFVDEDKIKLDNNSSDNYTTPDFTRSTRNN